MSGKTSMTAAARRSVAALLLGAAQLAGAAPDRGQALYSAHCRGCHTEQVHRRGGDLVSDWDSLVAQVRHCKLGAGREWSDADVAAVARHLNDRYYRLPAAKRMTPAPGQGKGTR